MSAIANKIFKYRSYTPIPFLIVMLIFENANTYSLVTGFLIALTGELIRLWGVSWAGSETRTTGKVGGSYLVVSGPFAHVRNPLYVGNILMYTGLGVMSYALFPWLQVFTFVFFTVQYYLIVKEEEGYLHQTFKAEFSDYVRNVPRFFPKFSSYKVDKIDQPPFSLKAGLRSETRTLQAFASVIFLILAKWYLSNNL